ncbi:MAG: universal stress protein [cyanobacterium endosymbiont of Rhopalodia yunnanensis]
MLANSGDVDLILIKKLGIKGISKIFVRSFSNYVIHYFHCSVPVIKR